MKSILTLIVSLVVSFTNTESDTKLQVLKYYLEIKDALIESDSQTVRKISTRVLPEIKLYTNLEKKAQIINSFEKLSTSVSLEKQRKAFAELSTMIWKLVKSDKNIHLKLYYNYCPMKKAYWISDSATIKNPYYGNSMLSCGSIKEIKN